MTIFSGASQDNAVVVPFRPKWWAFSGSGLQDSLARGHAKRCFCELDFTDKQADDFYYSAVLEYAPPVFAVLQLVLLFRQAPKATLAVLLLLSLCLHFYRYVRPF